MTSLKYLSNRADKWHKIWCTCESNSHLYPYMILPIIFSRRNWLSFSADFAALDTLELLDMSYNELTGIFPPSLRALSSLKSLVLEGNELNGSLPTQGMYLIDLM